MAADLVLIPSPLVGPETWAGVASALGEAGRTCTIAELEDDGHPPYWRQHVDSVRRAVPLEALTVVLVAHSGAGPLLGAIAHELGARVSGLLFVDAGLPAGGKTRLEMLEAEMGGPFARGLRRHLEAGGRYPEWSGEDLAPIIKDARLRTGVLRAQRPRGLDFWTEPIPAPGGWDALPGAYLRLSVAYAVPCSVAAALGWPVIERNGGHFDLLTDSAGVARDIEALLAAIAPDVTV